MSLAHIAIELFFVAALAFAIWGVADAIRNAK